MTDKDMRNPAKDYVQDLPRVVRHITTNDKKGNSVFLSTDGGDHHRELVNPLAIANTLYSTNQVPVDLNGDLDVNYAQQNEPGITVKNGTVCRMVDFAPGGVSPMHRAESLDLAVVIEGVFKLVLDSGEERVMQRGDVAIQRCASHSWINVTGNGLIPGRLLFVLHDVKDMNINLSKIDRQEVFPGAVGKKDVGLHGHVESARQDQSGTQIRAIQGGINYYESDLQ